MYFVGENVANVPTGFYYFILLVCPTSQYTTGGCRQFIISDNALGVRSRAGNPMAWSTWQLYSRNAAIVTTNNKTITMPANTNYVTITANTVASYTFIAWINIASSGSVRMAYPASATSSNTEIWSPTSSSTATTFICTALYRHN